MHQEDNAGWENLPQILCLANLHHPEETKDWATADMEIDTQLERAQVWEGVVSECGAES